jgi:hypothetical protein
MERCALNRILRIGTIAVFSTALFLAGGSTACADGIRLMNPEDIELEQTESTLLQVRRQLFSARQRNDQEAVDELEKQFDEIRKERARLLRVTWQM